MNPEDILNFWFGSVDSPEYGKPREEWFKKDPVFDDRLRTLFLSLYRQAATGQLDSWKNDPLSCLALIIALDQFPRNLFRGKAEAFATDELALSHAKHAVERQFDRSLLPVQRWFIYLPFEHSENIEDQRRGIELWTSLADDPDSTDPIDYAVRHLAVIDRFGRFPHRNSILGRMTTPEEEEFLKKPGSSF